MGLLWALVQPLSLKLYLALRLQVEAGPVSQCCHAARAWGPLPQGLVDTLPLAITDRHGGAEEVQGFLVPIRDTGR